MGIQHLLRDSGQKQSEIARALGVSEGTLSKWVNNVVPAERVGEFSRLTGISAALLRPDLAAVFAEPTPPSAPEAA